MRHQETCPHAIDAAGDSGPNSIERHGGANVGIDISARRDDGG
jgi:hypothetical protein